MNYTTLSVIVVIATTAAWSQGEAPATPAGASAGASAASVEAAEGDSPRVKIEAVTKAYEKNYREVLKRARAEKNHKKRGAIYQSDMPLRSETIDHIIKIAKETPKAEGVDKGLLWSLNRTVTESQREDISSLLLSHHPNSDGVIRLARIYAWAGGVNDLRQIIRVTSNEKTRDIANAFIALKQVSKKETEAEAIAMMKKLVESTAIKGDSHVFKLLQNQIMLVEKLGVGCTAPDIVGTDQDDKGFKLSDYRGQVVLLDFWGIW